MHGAKRGHRRRADNCVLEKLRSAELYRVIVLEAILETPTMLLRWHCRLRMKAAITKLQNVPQRAAVN